MRDWTGNKKTMFNTLGVSNNPNHKRQEVDFYSTDPIAIEELLKVEKFNNKIWECACGNGTISNKLTEHGYDVYSSDLYNHGFGDTGVDFLTQTHNLGGGRYTN